jgi:hypothetical protein
LPAVAPSSCWLDHVATRPAHRFTATVSYIVSVGAYVHRKQLYKRMFSWSTFPNVFLATFPSSFALIFIIPCTNLCSVGIATGWTAGVRFRAGARDFSLLHSVQTCSGVHLASYTMGSGGFFPGAKAAGV